MFKTIKAWYEIHERRISSVAFVFGFVWDQFTLTRVDLWLDNVVLIAYLAIALVCIYALNTADAWAPKHTALQWYAAACPALLLFVFGGLFSGFFVFYSRSASFATSWPFLLFLFGLLVGNEFFLARYARFTFQVGVFFIAFFSYA